MDAIDELWQRIETGVHLDAHQHGRTLAPSASEEALTHLERVPQVALPVDLRASYRRHDGGFTMRLVDPMAALPGERNTGDQGDIEPWEIWFQSLKEIAETWQVHEALLQDED